MCLYFLSFWHFCWKSRKLIRTLFRHPGIAGHSSGHCVGHFLMISQNPIQGWCGRHLQDKPWVYDGALQPCIGFWEIIKHLQNSVWKSVRQSVIKKCPTQCPEECPAIPGCRKKCPARFAIFQQMCQIWKQSFNCERTNKKKQKCLK